MGQRSKQHECGVQLCCPLTVDACTHRAKAARLIHSGAVNGTETKQQECCAQSCCPSHVRALCVVCAGVISDTTRRYLVTQRAVLPTSCCYLTTTALSPLYNYLFIFKWVQHLIAGILQH
jgi:hypothetical protein